MEVIRDGDGAVDTNLLLQGLKFLARLQSSAPVAVVRPVVPDADRTRDDGALLKPNLEGTRKRRHDDSPSELDKKSKRFVCFSKLWFQSLIDFF